jgi:hypothetical protein
MHILRITILSRGELHTSKRAILKICFDVLDEYCMMYSEKQCAILKDIFYMITNTMRFFIAAIPLIVKRALHAQEDSFLTQKPTCAR